MSSPATLSTPQRAAPEYGDWQSLYRSRITSADKAVEAIKPGMRLYLSGNCSVPNELVAALVRTSPRFIPPIEIVQILTVSNGAHVAPGLERTMRVNTLFISADVRAAVNEGRSDFTPCFLSEIPKLLHNGVLPIDAVFAQLSPPDEHGYCSYGVEVGVTKTAVENAPLVIAEINDRMPRTLGDSFVHVSRLTHIVPVSYPLPQMHKETRSEVERSIGLHCAGLIEDGSTLQMGIGGIPDAVLGFLGDKKDLGIHTELFSDGVIDLIEAGVINGVRKTLHPGKVVAGFIIGTQRLFDYVHNNSFFEFHPTEYINDPFIIAQNDRMVSINSAIEVDLTGQVCADSIGPRFFSGVGGQVDFVYGASRSRGGKPIIALPSTAMVKGRPISKIVPMLKPGAGVVTSRYHVHYVVTEHGVANLYGKSVRERARALIGLAAPSFRDDLEKAARDLHYL